MGIEALGKKAIYNIDIDFGDLPADLPISPKIPRSVAPERKSRPFRHRFDCGKEIVYWTEQEFDTLFDQHMESCRKCGD